MDHTLRRQVFQSRPCQQLNLNCFKNHSTAGLGEDTLPMGDCPYGAYVWNRWINQNSFRNGEQAYAYLYKKLGFDLIG